MFISKYNKLKIFLSVLVVGVLFIGVVLLYGKRETNQNIPNGNWDNITPTPAANGEAMEISGEMVCLPHRDQSGPQTMECAYGLKTPEGIYYGLRDSDPTYKNISGLGTGSTVTISGIFYPQEDTKYATEGVIEIQSVSKTK